MYQLFDYYRSSASARVRIALNLKGLPFEIIPIHLLNQGGEQLLPSYQLINPQCLVPAFKDGEKIITQSLAIIEYLDEIHPNPPLLPTDPYQKALVRAFALTIAADLHPLNNLRVLRYLTEESTFSEAQKNEWYLHWLTKGLQALETQLKSQPSTTFCFGDQPTLADICLVPQIYNARRYSCDLTPYPRLVEIDANCEQHPAFIAARPTI